MKLGSQNKTTLSSSEEIGLRQHGCGCLASSTPIQIDLSSGLVRLDNIKDLFSRFVADAASKIVSHTDYFSKPKNFALGQL
jgi:hypothetical protein